MAEMHQDMYGATGKIGNKSYYQVNGKTFVREIVAPKNPKTTAQTLQRVLMMAVTMFYAVLKTICNHSFEGLPTGAKCANKFKKVNLKYLRERAEGHLPGVSVGIDAEGGHKAYVNSPGRTYAEFAKAWGLQRGDQLTFVTVQKREGKYEAGIARIVLNPRNADGSGAPMTTEIVDSQGQFPCSNWKNKLNFSLFEFDTDHFNFVLGSGGIVVAAGIIVSRKSSPKDKDDTWFRSNCQLVLNEAGFGSDLCSLMQAVENSYSASDVDMESEFYLNNAGGGGTGSASEVTPGGGGGGVEPGQPTYNSTATINGANQNIAGGSVTATAPVTTVIVSGTNLSEVAFTAKVDGSGDAINPTSHDANGASFTGLNVEAGHSLVVYRGGNVWFTITAQPASGDDDDVIS